jgi:menaquinone-dependent protoporphyrinogen IX oxidase
MEKKAIVVYATQFGSTQRYAEWIAKDCGAKLVPVENTTIDEMAEYETVIFGAPVYAGRIWYISLIKDNRELLANSRVVVFTTGLTEPGDDVAFQEVLKRNFTDEEQKGIHFFHFPGALDFKKMNFMQKNIMRVLKRAIKKKAAEKRSKMESYILEYYGGLLDFTNYAYIKPLVKYVQNGDGALPGKTV